MKKLLLITILLFSTFSFAQQNEQSVAVVNKNQHPITLLSISAYPNPFSVNTQINFSSTKEQIVEFTVKNLLGKTVYGERFNAKSGNNTIPFNRNELVKGMYIYSLQTDNEILSKRLVIK